MNMFFLFLAYCFLALGLSFRSVLALKSEGGCLLSALRALLSVLR